MGHDEHTINALRELLVGGLLVGAVGATIYSIVLFCIWLVQRAAKALNNRQS